VVVGAYDALDLSQAAVPRMTHTVIQVCGIGRVVILPTSTSSQRIETCAADAFGCCTYPSASELDTDYFEGGIGSGVEVASGCCQHWGLECYTAYSPGGTTVQHHCSQRMHVMKHVQNRCLTLKRDKTLTYIWHHQE
jgi:hypothetical protein